MRLVYIAVGWTVGLLLGLNGTFDLSLWLAMAAFLALLVILAWRTPAYRILNIAFLAFALGGLRASFVPQTSAIAAYNNTGGLTIEGVVTTDPDNRDERIQLQVDIDTLILGADVYDMGGRVLVYAPSTADVRYGDRVRVTGLLITPAEYDTFSYADFLAREGVFSIMQNAAVEVMSSGYGSPIYAALYDVRRQANAAINDFLPEPQAGLLAGILLGNERGISRDLQDDFNAVGAAHIVAISGFNMAIISGVVMGLLSGIISRKWLRAFLGLAVIVLYTLFVGASATVVRAAVMSSVLIIGQNLGRKTYVPATLAFVALVMSLQKPTVLLDIGFQLSFFATLGLALFATPLTERFNVLLQRIFPSSVAVPLGKFLGEPLVVSVAALMTTLPLIVLYFNRLSVVTLLVNLLVVPIQSWLMIIGGAAVLLVFVPPLAQFLYWLDMILLSWTIGVVRLFARLPFADVEFRIDRRVILLYFVVLIGWAFMHATQPDWWLRLGRFVRRQSVLSAVIFAGFSTTILMGAVAMSRPDGKLHVWMLDVGHNNAVFAQTPGGAQILVDGGRFPSRLLTAIGDRMPFTDREIEVLVITQPDEFEIGALAAVLERYDIGVVLWNGQPNQSEAFSQLQAELARHEVVIVRAGYTLNFDDGVRLEVLHPHEQPALTDDIDENTLVLRLGLGDISFLLTSDLSREGQAALMENGQWPLATVLQLPQHGTARSLGDSFLQAVQPQAVLIQTDRANRRGDPDSDILARLDNVPIFRTDEGGTLHLWTDGKTLEAAAN